MNYLIEQLGASLFNQMSIEQISKNVDLQPAQTQNILGQAVPLILKGLMKNTQSQNGLSDLFSALVRDHDGGILGQMSDLIKNPSVAKGEGMLGHILGNKKNTLENQIGKTNNIDTQKIAKIFAIAAPIIMGILGRQRKQNNWDQTGLSDALSKTNHDLRQKSEKEIGLIERMLDSDKDGSISDDIASLGLNVLRRWMS